VDTKVIGIDTNILIRWITLDDPIQCKRVEAIFQKHHNPNEIFIADSVLIEFDWVLSSAYDFNREQIADSLGMILRTRQFEFRNKETIVRAIGQYRNGEKDFSDCMIGELGHEFNIKTYTFDKALQNNSNFIVLK
jgi:predicted nucleic-acid-binding protein